ncbi:MAG: STAS domain-containing protein [Deltaproteobacteria bacterium]|nr:STAS domain-containing protein [Deltaproteobacteria bacterium]
MKYHIVEKEGFLFIRISGESKKNEAIMVKRMLYPYFKKEGIKVIVDLKALETFEPAILLGVLNGIRKEVGLLRGGVKLCSLNPETLNYLKQNRLDEIFYICEDEEVAKRNEWRNYGKR